MTIQIGQYRLGQFIDYLPYTGIKQWVYPGGEVGISMPHVDKSDSILARVKSSDDFMQLLQVAACIPKRQRKNLIMPYFPYARQDRDQGSMPCALRIAVDIIDQLGFDNLLVADPHSVALQAMFKNTRVEVLGNRALHQEAQTIAHKATALVMAPDAGAAKRAMELAQLLNCPYSVTLKTREPETGHLKLAKLGDIPEGTDKIIVIDDICDGGYTFGGLAKEIRKVSNASLHLLVTHGIFSGNFAANLELYNQVVTTDSFKTHYDSEKKTFEEAGINFYVVKIL